MPKGTYHVFFTNLSNQMKMNIILSLRKKEKSVGDLVKDLGVEQSLVSHSLKSLKSCNIVNSRRNGKQIIYSLNKDTILPMLKLIDKHASKHCSCKSCDSSMCLENK